MEKIKFRVEGNQIAVEVRPAVITAGTVGLEAEFAFDSQWDTLSKILVFKAGEKVVATALAGNTHSIPWEVLEKPNQWLCVGVYGANGEGSVVIPTLWAKVAVIHTGTDPEGDPALEPSAPIWQEAVALAELGASAEQELRAAVDSLSEELQLSDGTRNLGDMLYELVVLDRYNEYMLYQHTDNRENPHQVTAEQVGAVKDEELTYKVEDIVVTDLTGGGPIRAEVFSVASENVDIVLQDYDLIRYDEGDQNPRLNVVTKEQHDADIENAKDAAQQAEDRAMDEITLQVEDLHENFSRKTEVDAKIAETKAVIVTVNGTTPSHTSQQIYALIQAGKVVYLQLWGNTYVICSACTESEAKFENSVVTTATGADGNTYNVQRFRLYFIKNDRYAAQQTIESPSIEYLDAAIAALNQ